MIVHLLGQRLSTTDYFEPLSSFARSMLCENFLHRIDSYMSEISIYVSTLEISFYYRKILLHTLLLNF